MKRKNKAEFLSRKWKMKYYTIQLERFRLKILWDQLGFDKL